MRVLIADDQTLVRETLGAYLEHKGSISVCLVGTLAEALRVRQHSDPFDLALFNYYMDGMMGLTGLGKMLEANVATGVAILSGNPGRSLAQDTIDQGAIGFLPKTMAAKDLVNAVHLMAAGEQFFPEALLVKGGENHTTKKRLSRRETEVLSGLCQGFSNKEIARELNLQEVTIKLHVRTLCRKLEAKNRTQAAMIAKEGGLI